MNVLVDEIKIDGISRPGKVLMSLMDIDIVIDPEPARDIAFALLSQADRAEELTRG